MKQPLSYSFVVEGNPIPKQRHRTRKGIPYTPARTRRWEAHVAGCYQGPKFDGPVRVEMAFYRETRRRCDLDNLSKSVWDALNGVAYDDDAQIIESCQYRALDRERPRVEVTITEIVKGGTE